MCTILAHLTVEQANSIMDMERATKVPGPLAAVVMDDTVTVILIYHSNTLVVVSAGMSRRRYPEYD